MASKVASKDGTAIAFERKGSGPAVLLVDGALAFRGFGPSVALADALADNFMVITYDRRGRGESGDAKLYAVEREIDDIAALVDEAGGEVCVWGISSGAALALEAAKRLRAIRKLALYEPPFIVDGSRPTTENDWREIKSAVAAGRRDDAVKAFLKLVGVPSFFIGVTRLLPVWKKLLSVAHTLPYDGALIANDQLGKALKRGRWSKVTVPTLVMAGGKSPEWMKSAAKELASVLPDARFELLPGERHDVHAKALAPVLAEFFK